MSISLTNLRTRGRLFVLKIKLFYSILLSLNFLITNLLQAKEEKNSDYRVIAAPIPFYINYNEDTKTASGYLADLYRHLKKRLNLEKDMEVMPFSRLWHMLNENKENIIAFPVARVSHREKLLSWKIRIYENDALLFLSNKKNPYASIDLEAAKSLSSIGVIRDTVMSQLLLKKGIKKSQLQDVKDSESNFKMLQSGRIDAVFTSRSILSFVSSKVGSEFYKEHKPINEFPVYMVTNLGFNHQIINKLIAEFEAMKKDGAYNKIKEKYSIK